MSGTSKAIGTIAVKFLVPVIATLAGGALIGTVSFFAGTLFPAPLLISALSAVVTGVVIALSIRSNQYRTRTFLVMLALLAAVMVQGVREFTAYQDFKENISEHLMPESTPGFFSRFVDSVSKPFIDTFLEMKTGRTGFTGYLLFTAEEPLKIGFGRVWECPPAIVWMVRIGELIALTLIGFSTMQGVQRWRRR